MDWKIHVTAAAIVERAGRFLIIEETSAGRLVLNQPAGHLEQGESLQEAVVRETLEETGWHIQPEHFIIVQQWDRPERGDTYLRFVFSAKGLCHDPERDLDPVISQVLWLDLASLEHNAARLRSPMVLDAIHAYLTGPRHHLTLVRQSLHCPPPVPGYLRQNMGA